MPTNPNPPECHCIDEISRRRFFKNTMVGAAAVAVGVLPLRGKTVEASATAVTASSPKSETLVTTLFKSLTDETRQKICFPFDHPLRSKVDANWQITDKSIAEILTADQQAMVREIFQSLH